MKLRKYSGFPPWTNGELQTCTAFINSLEENFDDNSIPTILNKWLQGPALDWWTNFEQENNNINWNITKQELVLKFHCALSVKEKVNIRQSLKQNPEENVEDFLDRCTYAQYAITDGIVQQETEVAGFERDILLNFLLGMNQELQSYVISSNEKSLKGFFSVALKIEEEKIRENENANTNNKNEILESPAPMQQHKEQRPKRKRKKPKAFDEDYDDYNMNDYENLTNFDLEEVVKIETTLQPVKNEQETEVLVDKIQTFDADNQTHCKICNRAVLDEKRLEVHMLVRHRKDPTQFQCDLCQKHLKTEDSLKKHVQFTCLQDRPESCPICFKNFICKKSVKLHVQSVHLKEKPNICDECGKGFCTPTSLRTHRENVHEKLKKYVCHLCNKAYGNQGNLYVHNQRHHQRYSYCCESCGKQFCRPFELRRHMTVKHGEGILPYPCDQCQKAFFEPKELKNHIAITHEGERPHSCPSCSETFTRKSAMTRHIKRKHPENLIHSTLWKKSNEEDEENLEEVVTENLL